MKPRFVFVHGNGGEGWDYAWAPWLKQKLEGMGYETHFADMPDPELARRDIWLPYLENEIGVGANDVIIGWSSGATAAMRYAETHKILGSILVSPSYTDLGDDKEKQSGYFDYPWDWKAIKSNQSRNEAGIFGGHAAGCCERQGNECRAHAGCHQDDARQDVGEVMAMYGQTTEVEQPAGYDDGRGNEYYFWCDFGDVL
jgi:predicted alpha/beta hydrolase family esterase